LFVAIEVPDEVKRHLNGVRDRLVRLTFGHLYEVKWVADRNLHITLKFLGEVDQARAALLSDRLSQIEVDPANLYPDRLVFFPPRGPVRVIGAGLAGDADALHRLHNNIDAACEELRFAREDRPFVPHITLGRNKRGRYEKVAGFVRGNPPFDCWPGPTFTASSFALVQSELRPDGPVYTPLARFGGA
jgi:2'-5' RNA ligase